MLEAAAADTAAGSGAARHRVRARHSRLGASNVRALHGLGVAAGSLRPRAADRCRRVRRAGGPAAAAQLRRRADRHDDSPVRVRPLRRLQIRFRSARRLGVRGAGGHPHRPRLCGRDPRGVPGARVVRVADPRGEPPVPGPGAGRAHHGTRAGERPAVRAGSAGRRAAPPARGPALPSRRGGPRRPGGWRGATRQIASARIPGPSRTGKTPSGATRCSPRCRVGIGPRGSPSRRAGRAGRS